MVRLLRIFYRSLLWLIFISVSSIIIYLIFSILLSLIPVNKSVDLNGEIDIYIKSNGVHLDIILPLKNDIKDWNNVLSIDSSFTSSFNYVSFGWGDREFYINTPEWSDLTVRTAVNAMFFNSQSAIHVDYCRNINVNDNCKLIQVNIEQYKLIIGFIENSFRRDIDRVVIPIAGIRYHSFDSFYEAKRSFHLFYTCNTWVNECLKNAGLRACVWTPFERGVLFHYK